jgi:predicted DNA-binding transcriptional regulator YafY
MNRTDRLYGLVEELRAVAPRPRSARWLAGRFEVSVRTVERDISALQQTGTPIYAEPGRSGGYCLDKSATLPPVNLTPAEAVAMALALRQLRGTPFDGDAGTALRKLMAAMQTDDAAAAHRLAARVHLVDAGTRARPSSGPATLSARPLRPSAGSVTPSSGPATPDAQPAKAAVPRLVADAVAAGRVLRIMYGDRGGAMTEREVEPLGYLGTADHWYLVAWCRLRDGVRAFRTDRVLRVTASSEVPTPRELSEDELDIPRSRVQHLSLI